MSSQSVYAHNATFYKAQNGNCSLTFFWYNQREFLHHGCQQLHHGFDVLGAENDRGDGVGVNWWNPQ